MAGSWRATPIGVLVVASIVAGCSSVEGTPPPQSATATATASDAPSTGSEATPGASPVATTRAHVLSTTADDGVGITVTIPASGWVGDPGGWLLQWGPRGGDPPDGAGIITYTVDEEFYVFGDACAWSSTMPATPATTVDEIAAAMGQQSSRAASEAEDITVGGYTGKRITLHVPDDADFSNCDDEQYATFGVTGEIPARYHQGPGQIDEMWIIDVDGKIALMDGAYFAGTPQRAVDELHAILNSATFDVAPQASPTP